MIKALLDSWDSGRPQDQLHGPQGLPKKTLPPGRPADVYHGYQAVLGSVGGAHAIFLMRTQRLRTW